jgi:16S rRNA (uracil1498-N3)-methyltransferase
MTIFYAPDIAGSSYCLNEDESKHAIRVLRLCKGDQVHLIDGKGGLFEAIIESDHPKKCELKIIAVHQEFGKRNYYLHIAIAPTKNMDRFEWFLEKATEIGIDEITPLLTSHSERKSVNLERLEKVLVASAKQSVKAYVPVLNEIMSWSAFLKKELTGQKFIATCSGEERKPLSSIYKRGEKAHIIIGPEGDFTPDEIESAIKCNFAPITFGSFRLRTETAGVVASHTFHFINQFMP